MMFKENTKGKYNSKELSAGESPLESRDEIIG
jgi:hypothetical protein